MNNKRQKWWEIATTQDEIDLFDLIARDPEYDWRTVQSILKKLQWSPTKLGKVVDPFIKKKIIIEKNTKKGFYLGYWERVDDKKQNVEEDEDNNIIDPNVI